MILGVGDTEIKTAINIVEECIAKRDKNKEIFKQEIEEIKKEYDNLAEKYKNKSANEVQERYSHLWYSLYDIYICLQIL